MDKPVDIWKDSVAQVQAAITQLTGEVFADADYTVTLVAPSKATDAALTESEVFCRVNAWLLSWSETLRITGRVIHYSRLLVELSGGDGMDGAFMQRTVVAQTKTDAQVQAAVLLAATGVIPSGMVWDL